MPDEADFRAQPPRGIAAAGGVGDAARPKEDGMRDHRRDPRRAPDDDPAAVRRATPAPPSTHAAPAPAPSLDPAGVLRLQRTAGNRGVVQLLAGDEERSPVHDVVGSGGGRPLDASTRTTMESAFGRSFEDVRVHDDARATRSAESVGANAYTVGSDVVFRSGQFDPGSAAGQRTLAHELAHVVQQSEGPVEGSDAPGGIRVSDPSDRFEQAAEHRADSVMSTVASPSAAASAGSGTAVQREEDAAAVPLQREVGPEEDEEAET
jgi:hypothetical protein